MHPRCIGKGLISLLTSREEIPELLKLDDAIDLVIPRGSNELITPAACNAMETLLVHAELLQNGGVNELLIELQTKSMNFALFKFKLQEIALTDDNVEKKKKIKKKNGSGISPTRQPIWLRRPKEVTT
ncbi:unnamed protein product [Lactuca virosa]|uniref:Uncharacterized protein n=1 Tax=Lactuca virosa TaxID=75947 RepID=A0AAU9P7D0_9ASTR|nr:unnamed protein product [Lactuca virosa]